LIVKRGKKTKIKRTFSTAEICVNGVCRIDLITLSNIKPLKLDKQYQWQVKATYDGIKYKSKKETFILQTSVAVPTLDAGYLPTYTPYGQGPSNDSNNGRNRAIPTYPTVQVYANSISGINAAIAGGVNSNGSCKPQHIVIVVTSAASALTISQPFPVFTPTPDFANNFGPSGIRPIQCYVTIKGQGKIIRRSTTTTNKFRIFTVLRNAFLRLENLTLENGYAIERGGGAVSNHEGELQVYRNTIRNNTVNADTGYQWFGGGIYSYYGRLSVVESVITGNMVGTLVPAGDGGGIGVIESVTVIQGNDIRSNTTTRNGDGVFLNANSILRYNCLEDNNHSSASPNLSISVFNNNKPQNWLYNWWGSANGPIINNDASGIRDSINVSATGVYIPYRNVKPANCTAPAPTDTPTPTKTNTPVNTPTRTPTPTYTASRTPLPSNTPVPCVAKTIQTTDGVSIYIRSAPRGEVVGLIPSNTNVILDGGWDAIETEGGGNPIWWWFVEYNGQFGYVKETLITPNACLKTPRQPPLEVGISTSTSCSIKLAASSANVVNHALQVVRTITDKNIVTKVYGRSSDEPSTRYLIAEPGLAQEWVTQSLFAPVNDADSLYGCQPRVLGRFNYIDVNSNTGIWKRIGYYANRFKAPISPLDGYLDGAFRNSQLFGTHNGVDLVYAPNDGAGTAQEFRAYPPREGVIVEVGPSGITGRFLMDGFGANPLPNRSGTSYENGTLFFAVTWFYDGNPNNDTFESPTSGYKYDAPKFGVQPSDFGSLTGGVFRSGTTPCTSVTPPAPNTFPSLPGCVGGADRQVIIWYGETPTRNLPDIQTIYYHVDVTAVSQYPNWDDKCRGGTAAERMTISVNHES
jgi:hypothetical protein